MAIIHLALLVSAVTAINPCDQKKFSSEGDLVTNACCKSDWQSMNECFQGVNKPSENMSIAQGGVLVHGWDGTEANNMPWVPGAGQGSTGYRWSSSYLNAFTVSQNCAAGTCLYPSTVSIYNIFDGGMVFSIPHIVVTCIYPGDAGTDTRLNGGCGNRTSGVDWCGDSCSFQNPAGCTGQCTTVASKLGAMLLAQHMFSQTCMSMVNLDMCYNEVVVEPVMQNDPYPTGYDSSGLSIAAFFQATGTNPNLRSCPYFDQKAFPEAGGDTLCCKMDAKTRTPVVPSACTPISDGKITCQELCLYSKKFKDTPVPLLNFDATNIAAPFSLNCSTFAACVQQGTCKADSC